MPAEPDAAAAFAEGGRKKRQRLGKGIDAFIVRKKDIGDVLGRYVARGNGVPDKVAAPAFMEMLGEIAALFNGSIENRTALAILQKARDSYADYFSEWFDNDLLLAATLLDPTQACQYYFLSGREGAVADTGKAWTSIETLARDLMEPPA